MEVIWIIPNNDKCRLMLAGMEYHRLMLEEVEECGIM